MPDEVYRWNPHTDTYAKTEEAIMDDVGMYSHLGNGKSGLSLMMYQRMKL
jgi:hypothetical protein